MEDQAPSPTALRGIAPLAPVAGPAAALATLLGRAQAQVGGHWRDWCLLTADAAEEAATWAALEDCPQVAAQWQRFGAALRGLCPPTPPEAAP